jgi:hypothetical protein
MRNQREGCGRSISVTPNPVDYNRNVSYNDQNSLEQDFTGGGGPDKNASRGG